MVYMFVCQTINYFQEFVLAAGCRFSSYGASIDGFFGHKRWAKVNFRSVFSNNLTIYFRFNLLNSYLHVTVY